MNNTIGVAYRDSSNVGQAVDALHGLPVATQSKQFSSAPSSAAIQTSGGDVFTLAAGGKGVIVNLGTNPLFVKRGTGATSTSLNYVLKAGSVNDDGSGAMIEIDDFIGVVSVTGTAPRFNAWKA